MELAWETEKRRMGLAKLKAFFLDKVRPCCLLAFLNLPNLHLVPPNLPRSNLPRFFLESAIPV